MSITDLIASKGLHALLARAIAAYRTMGISGSHLRRCIEYTVRYGLGATRLGHERVSDELYNAIAHVAGHQVADLVLCHAAGSPACHRDQSRQPYWVDKVCEVVGIDTWLDDSLDKWFLDMHHPIADVIVQACRHRVMDYLASCAAGDTAADHDDIVIDVVHELQARFPALARFSRHLPAAIAGTIEQDVLGIPLVDKAEPVTAGIAGIAGPAARPLSRAHASGAPPSYSTTFPEPATTDMRPTYP